MIGVCFSFKNSSWSPVFYYYYLSCGSCQKARSRIKAFCARPRTKNSQPCLSSWMSAFDRMHRAISLGKWEGRRAM